jgi:hypothetical protein
MTETICPILHMNGTSKKSLVDGREGAYIKIQEAIKALCEMAPNGRDYYLVDGLMGRAQAQHDRRISILIALQDEIIAEIEQLTEFK